MPEEVNRPRRYDASGRQEQARLARSRILTAAREQLLSVGYSATTVPSVARSAAVSVQSVYKAFGSKAALAKAVFDVAIAGDDGPRAMLERESLAEVRQESDPYTKLALYAQFVAETAPRHAPIQLVIRAAAAIDADAAHLWEQLASERLTGMTMLARDLAPHLREGVTPDDARDILWAHNSVEHWDLLVGQRHWSHRRYALHLSRTLIHALLPTRSPAATD